MHSYYYTSDERVSKGNGQPGHARHTPGRFHGADRSSTSRSMSPTGHVHLDTPDDEFGVMKSSSTTLHHRSRNNRHSNKLSSTKERRSSPYGQPSLTGTNSRRSGTTKARSVRGTRSSSLTSCVRSTSKKHHKRGRSVRFNPRSTIHSVPVDQVWRAARRGTWKMAPEDDELWDGCLRDFRPRELTRREFLALQTYGSTNYLGLRENQSDEHRSKDTYSRTDSHNYDDWYSNNDFHEGNAQHESSLPGNQLMQNSSMKHDSQFQVDSHNEAAGDIFPAGFDDDTIVDEDYASSFGYLNAQEPPPVYPTNLGCFSCTPMLDWTVHDVCDWAVEVMGTQYAGYVDVLQAHGIHGDFLFTADRHMLQSIGIKSHTARKVLLLERDNVIQTEKFPLRHQRCSCPKKYVSTNLKWEDHWHKLAAQAAKDHHDISSSNISPHKSIKSHKKYQQHKNTNPRSAHTGAWYEEDASDMDKLSSRLQNLTLKTTSYVDDGSHHMGTRTQSQRLHSFASYDQVDRTLLNFSDDTYDQEFKVQESEAVSHRPHFR